MIRHARMQGRPTLFLPGLDHASIAAQYVLDRILAKEGESRQSLGRERYLERMWAFINATREVMLGQQRRVGGVVRLVPAAIHDGRRLGEGRPRRVRAPVPRRAGVPDRGASSTGARAAGRACQRPRGDPDAETGSALDGPLPPDRRGDRRARSATRPSPSPRPARRRSSATRRSPSTRRIRATRRWSGAAPGSRSSSGTSRSSPTPSSNGSSAPARSRSRRPTTRTTTRPAGATGCR